MNLKFLNPFQIFCILISFSFALFSRLYASDCEKSLRQVGGSFFEKGSEIVYLHKTGADEVFPEIEAMREHLQEANEEYLLRESEFGVEFQILPSNTHFGRIAKWLKERFRADIIYAPFALGHEELSFTLNRSIFISHREFKNLQVDETFDHEIQHLVLNMTLEEIANFDQSVLTTRFFDLRGSQSARISSGISEILVLARDVRRRMSDLLRHTKNLETAEEMLDSPIFLKLERELADKILDLKEMTRLFEEAVDSMQEAYSSFLIGMREPKFLRATKSEEGDLKLRYQDERFGLVLRLMRENKETWMSAEIKTPISSHEPASITLLQWRSLADTFFEAASENPTRAFEKFQSLIDERAQELLKLLELAESFHEAAARALWMARSENLQAMTDFLSDFSNKFSVMNQESIDQMMDVFLNKAGAATDSASSSPDSTDLKPTYDHVIHLVAKEPERLVVSEDLNLAVELALRGFSKLILLSRDRNEIERFRRYLELANEEIDFEEFLQALQDDSDLLKTFKRHGEEGYHHWQRLARSKEIQSFFLAEDASEWAVSLREILNETSPSVVFLKTNINDETKISLKLKEYLISGCFEEQSEKSKAFMSRVFVPMSEENALFYRSQPAFYFLANDLRFEDQMKRKGVFDFFSFSESQNSNLEAFRGRFIKAVSTETQEDLGSGFLVFDSVSPYLKLRTEEGQLKRAFYDPETSDLSVISPPTSLRPYFSIGEDTSVAVKSRQSDQIYEVYLDQILDIVPKDGSVGMIWMVRLQSEEKLRFHFDPTRHEIIRK